MEIKIDCDLCGTKRSVFLLPGDELKTMQDYVAAINQTQMQVGSFEYQKIQLIQKMGALESKLTEFNTGLQKKYGNVSVNITDGSIKEKVN